MWIGCGRFACIEFPWRTEDAPNVRVGLEQREEHRNALNNACLDLGTKVFPVFPVPVIDTLPAFPLGRLIRFADVNARFNRGLFYQRAFQGFAPGSDIFICAPVQFKAERSQQFGVLPVRLGTDANIGNMAETRADLNEHRLQLPGADNGAKDVHHCHVSVADAMKDDDVADKVGVGLLPKRLFAFAPDRGDDRSDIECLGVGVQRVIQRVVPHWTVERHFNVIVSPAKRLKNLFELAAKIALYLQNDAGKFSRRRPPRGMQRVAAWPAK